MNGQVRRYSSLEYLPVPLIFPSCKFNAIHEPRYKLSSTSRPRKCQPRSSGVDCPPSPRPHRPRQSTLIRYVRLRRRSMRYMVQRERKGKLWTLPRLKKVWSRAPIVLEVNSIDLNFCLKTCQRSQIEKKYPKISQRFLLTY